MDWIGQKERLQDFFKKNRILFLFLLVGLFLMVLPAQEESEQQEEPLVLQTEQDLQTSLAELLSQIAGAGEVEVLLTQACGEEIFYQEDEDISLEDQRRDTVLVTNSDREETGLVKQINPPVYLGAVVVCQGADNATVQLSIVKAVMSVTGLTSDHITVLKMK